MYTFICTPVEENGCKHKISHEDLGKPLPFWEMTPATFLLQTNRLTRRQTDGQIHTHSPVCQSIERQEPVPICPWIGGPFKDLQKWKRTNRHIQQISSLGQRLQQDLLPQLPPPPPPPPPQQLPFSVLFFFLLCWALPSAVHSVGLTNVAVLFSPGNIFTLLKRWWVFRLFKVETGWFTQH